MEKNNNLYVLEELVSDMEQSIETVDKVMKQQRKLVNILKKENDAEFESFIEANENQLKNYETQKKTLTDRVDLIKNTLADIYASQNKDEIIDIVSNVLEGLGTTK